jgi:spore germination cell wall hydrolase CwlJ-like protein
MMKTIALCLAITMYREARSEPISTQIAVAKVLMNRAVKEKITPCKALEKAYQWAWVKKYKVVTPDANGKIDDCVWQQTKRIAHDIKK